MALLFGLAGHAKGEVFRVGPDGDYAAVADAIAAAQKFQGTHEIRLEAGTYFENLSVIMRNQYIAITGGWDATFETLDVKPVSAIDGRLMGPVLAADVQGGSLALQRLRLIRGSGVSVPYYARGGGLFLLLESTHFEFTESAVSSSSAMSGTGGSAFGGGIYLRVSHDTTAILQRSAITGNTIGGFAAGGAGLFYVAEYDSARNSLLVSGCTFDSNREVVSINGIGSGAGMRIFARGDQNTVTILDNRFYANRITAVRPGDPVYTRGTAMELIANSRGVSMDARRNSIRDRRPFETVPDAAQVSLEVGEGTIRISDSEIVDSPTRGVEARVFFGASVYLTNLTVADNAGIGLTLERESSATLSLANSLVFHNSTALVATGSPTLLSNYFKDPDFVDPPRRYDLDPRSVARNAGAAAPPGGLSTLDLRGLPRVREGAVDIGAYELQ